MLPLLADLEQLIAGYYQRHRPASLEARFYPRPLRLAPTPSALLGTGSTRSLWTRPTLASSREP